MTFGSDLGWLRSRPWVMVVAVVAVACAVRLPMLLASGPIDDEALYVVVGNEIAAGGRPYVDAIERKPPLLFWVYATIVRAAGPFNWRALHAIALAWTLATMLGLFVLGRGLFDRATGLMAALLYAVYQPWGTWTNLAFNGEVMMNLPIVWAWAIGFARSRSAIRLELMLAGALLAIAFLLKQPGAIAALPFGFYLLLPAYRRSRAYTAAAAVLQAVLLTVGFGAVLAMTALLLHRQSVLGDAVYWAILDHDVPHVFWQRGILHTVGFVAACLPLVLGAIGSLRNSDWWKSHKAEQVALSLLVFASAIGTAASGRFHPHYYIQLVMPLAIVAAPYLVRLPTATAWGAETTRRWLVPWLGATAVAFLLIGARGVAAAESTESGRYVAEHSSPTDRIFVWGQSPRIYVDAQRRPATRYVTTFPLTGFIFGPPLRGVDTAARIVPGAWQQFEVDCTQHPPRFIVDVHDPDVPYPIERFPPLAAMIVSRYHLVATTREGVVYERTP